LTLRGRLTSEDGGVDEVRADKTGDEACDKEFFDLSETGDLSDDVHQGQEDQEEENEVEHFWKLI
jgi:hypothetical protein